jgi:hypothetical protein
VAGFELQDDRTRRFSPEIRQTVDWPGICSRTWRMRTFIALALWFILLVLCWPLALIMIFLFPLVWLLLLPFRIIGFTLTAVFDLIKAIVLLPFRILKIA